MIEKKIAERNNNYWATIMENNDSNIIGEGREESGILCYKDPRAVPAVRPRPAAGRAREAGATQGHAPRRRSPRAGGRGGPSGIRDPRQPQRRTRSSARLPAGPHGAPHGRPEPSLPPARASGPAPDGGNEGEAKGEGTRAASQSAREATLRCAAVCGTSRRELK